MSAARTGLEIAVVGMAGRFPGASSVARLWSNVASGVESITAFTRDELIAAGVAAATVDDADYVRARAVLDDVEGFDRALFDFSPHEARMMDPQHRVFLECAWAAMEDGGASPAGGGRAVGVFASAGFPNYLLQLHEARSAINFASAETMLGNDKDHVATRVAYELDLGGPAMGVQTACSSSLVAIHQACRSLITGDCDAALAGGVSIPLPYRAGYLAPDGGVMSRDGHCRAFDASSTGFVPGAGAGVVYLKRLEDAERDGDPIRAVIRGSAINNDGASKVGYTAPSVDRQARALAAAYAFAEVDPASVGYVEAHGTGTRVGDPIEIAALARVMGQRSSPCWIGSLKTNIGHLDVAAGVAGLIKAVLCLEHRTLVPSLNYSSPNPEIPFDALPFRVCTETRAWTDVATHRAAVTALGLGGTNAHVVLEAHRQRPRRSHSGWHVVPVSAHSEASLRGSVAALADAIDAHDLGDVAYTLAAGRRTLRHRSAVVARDAKGAATALRVASATHVEGSPPVVFMFPGSGAAHLGMARTLLREDAAFAADVKACLAGLPQDVSAELSAILDSPARVDPERLRAPSVGLPSVFVVSYASARRLMRAGVEPSAMIGLSLGEYTAACLAGVMSLSDALKLVATRGRLYETHQRAAAMVTARASASQLAPLLVDGVEISTYAAPDVCNLSCTLEVVDALERRLAEAQIAYSRVPIAMGSHCALVEPMLPALGELARTLTLSPPQRRYVSNLSGGWAGEEVAAPHYWTQHLRQPVRFADGLAAILAAHPNAILVEVGPGQSLRGLVQGRAEWVLAALPHAKEDRDDMGAAQELLARLWTVGASVDLARLRVEGAGKVSLPSYHFDRERCWVDPPRHAPARTKHHDVSRWFHLPGYRPTVRPTIDDQALAADESTWLVVGETPAAAAIAARLRATGRAVFTTTDGPASAPRQLRIEASDPRTYDDLTNKFLGGRPSQLRVVHTSTLRTEPAEMGRAAFTLEQRVGYASVVGLLRAFAKAGLRTQFVAMVSQAQSPLGERLRPEQSTMLGPILVAPQEAPELDCRWVDVEPQAAVERVAEIALAEALHPGPERWVSHRGHARFARSYSAVTLDRPRISALRPGGRYLIVGGLGPVGRQLGEQLAERYRARLALVSRTALPPENEWLALAASDRADEVAVRVRAVLRMRAHGAEVKVLRADASQLGELRAAVERIDAAWGGVDGALHVAASSSDGSANHALAELTREASERQFEAKVYASYNLAQVFDGRDPEFVALFSSNASVLGGLGLTAYTAANAFVDAFAQRLRADGRPWVSINWDVWQTDGSAPPAGGIAEWAMSPDESFEALDRIVSTHGLAQVVVSPVELEARLDEWVRGPIEAAATPAVVEPAAAPTEIERALIAICKEVLGVETVTPQDNFFNLGGHSLLAVHLRARVKKVLSRDLPLEVIFRSGTVEGMAAALGDGDSRYRPLVVFRETGTNPAFYCVHAGSGFAAPYEGLSRYLGEEQPFVAFEARGLDGAAAPFESLAEMVTSYIGALRKHQPQGPYMLGGWCAGGTIAFEMAQRLRADGEVVYLALMDMDEPNGPIEDEGATRDLFTIARTYARTVGVDLPLRPADLAALDEDAQHAYVLEQYRVFNIVPRDATVASMRQHWEVFMSTVRATRDYHFTRYDGSIALFMATELDYRRLVDKDVAESDILSEAQREAFAGRAERWRDLSTRPIQVFEIEATHSRLALEPAARSLADCLLDWMESKIPEL